MAILFEMLLDTLVKIFLKLALGVLVIGILIGALIIQMMGS